MHPPQLEAGGDRFECNGEPFQADGVIALLLAEEGSAASRMRGPHLGFGEGRRYRHGSGRPAAGRGQLACRSEGFWGVERSQVPSGY